MPRKKTPKLCSCGCEEMTRGGEFIPGHDAKLISAIVKSVGGIANLRDIVEESNYAKNAIETNSTISSATDDRKVCPECNHVFLSGTWGGIDAHWRAHHEDVMSYDEAWPLIKAGNYKRPS